MTAGTEGIRAGDRVMVDGRPRVVLGASGTVVRFADDDGAVEEAPVAELVGSGRLRLQPRGTGGHPGAQVGLAGLPPEAVERARWWEAHIIEVVDGTCPDAPAGIPPRPAYDVERTSLRERERAKAAELSTPDRLVAASTVKHRRQRWQAEGLPGLVDRRVARRRQPGRPGRPGGGRGDGAGDRRGDRESSRTATFIVWRTAQILAERATARRDAVAGHVLPAVRQAVGGQAHDRVRPSPAARWPTGPQRPFRRLTRAAPGELMQIDSTPAGRAGAAGRRGAGTGGADRR